MIHYHLAELNIARMRGLRHEPIMAEFIAQLDYINRVADSTPGFVWRLQTEAGDATSIRAFLDERLIVNLSVWESIEALFQYAYKTEHIHVLRRRPDWFEPMQTPYMALWWIPTGHIPTVEEAKLRLEHLTLHGPTAYAFTFKTRFEPPNEVVSEIPAASEPEQNR